MTHLWDARYVLVDETNKTRLARWLDEGLYILVIDGAVDRWTLLRPPIYAPSDLISADLDRLVGWQLWRRLDPFDEILILF